MASVCGTYARASDTYRCDRHIATFALTPHPPCLCKRLQGVSVHLRDCEPSHSLGQALAHLTHARSSYGWLGCRAVVGQARWCRGVVTRMRFMPTEKRLAGVRLCCNSLRMHAWTNVRVGAGGCSDVSKRPLSIDFTLRARHTPVWGHFSAFATMLATQHQTIRSLWEL